MGSYWGGIIMVNQITVDENNIITGWSIGGYIPDGIDVPEIPEYIQNSNELNKWCYFKYKGFYENPNDTPPDTLTPFKESKIIESKTTLAEWLANHPMLYKDGKYYACTAEKQSLLNGNLASYERAKNAGIEYPLKWNSTGDECVAWEYSDLLTLSLSIAAYVAPKVAMQQSIEVAINNCNTIEEVNEIVINYDE